MDAGTQGLEPSSAAGYGKQGAGKWGSQDWGRELGNISRERFTSCFYQLTCVLYCMKRAFFLKKIYLFEIWKLELQRTGRERGTGRG